MKGVLGVAKGLLVILLLAGSGYALYKTALPYLTPPCSQPITYSIGTYDARFGISETEMKTALAEAASLWNTEAGKVIVHYDEQGTIPVSLVYGDVQKVQELGAVIDSEQEAYNAKKAEVEDLRAEFLKAKRTYERLATSFERENAAYEKEVSYWNARGGAPAGEYQALQEQQKELRQSQKEVNSQVAVVNALSSEVNERVDELNALADVINKKANQFNQNAGEDFDQGEYVRDAAGERINIYGFTDVKELRRVLAHELGHAIGLSHVENPDSIMYSYDIADNFVLSDEDKAELRAVCHIEK